MRKGQRHGGDCRSHLEKQSTSTRIHFFFQSTITNKAEGPFNHHFYPIPFLLLSEVIFFMDLEYILWKLYLYVILSE